MSDNLERALALKQRELDLLLEIDAIRDEIDTSENPGELYEKLLRLLIIRLDADAGAMVVASEKSNGIEYQVAIGINRERSSLICHEVLDTHDASTIMPLNVEGWGAGIGLRVVLDDIPLGAVILLRHSSDRPFTEEDVILLNTAENQIDSAIIQARRLWALIQRNRELDTIYQLDQLRDQNADESELVKGLVETIIRQFKADLCMVFLTHADGGDIVTRSVVDKLKLTPQEFEHINQSVRKLRDVGLIAFDKENISLLGAPFIVNDMWMGAVVIGRKDGNFHHDDFRLLRAMISQMDSAVVYSRVIGQLAQRNKELEIIYNIDKIRDSDIDFDAMLQAVLGELCQGIDAEMGYIMLYSEDKEDQLEIKSSSRDGVMASPAYYEAINSVSRTALNEADMVYENNRAGEVRSIIAVPLILRERIIGVFGGVNSKHSRGFTAEDRRMLNAIVSQTDTAVFERMEQRRVRQVLGRSVDPKVLEYLLQNADAATVLAGERMMVSVLFADLRGSTEWAERTEPDKLAYTLNAYLGRMTEVIFEYGGTLDKFVGDEVIGLFGAPLPMEDHAERCAAAALAMQKVMGELIAEMATQGYELPRMGVGVSTGEAICGEFGTAQRTDYTAMGRMMNLGARLCSAAGGGEVVISEITYRTLESMADVEQLEDVTLKGIGNATAYKLLYLRTAL